MTYGVQSGRVDQRQDERLKNSQVISHEEIHPCESGLRFLLVPGYHDLSAFAEQCKTLLAAQGGAGYVEHSCGKSCRGWIFPLVVKILCPLAEISEHRRAMEDFEDRVDLTEEYVE